MSEQPKHTGGDWQAERGESGGYVEWFVRRDGDDRAIASDILDPETGLPSEENAHLIAAAKNLLEALIAQERVEWARRNLDALNADPLHPDRLALVMELQRATTTANMLRESAIAKAEGRGE